MAELSSFHDVRFPTAVSFGATGGPERRNEIVALTSGREKRNARFAQSRRRYDAGTGVRSLADLHDVLAFFEARRGSLHGFRFRDPFDMKSCRPERDGLGRPTRRSGPATAARTRFAAGQELWRAATTPIGGRSRKPVAGTLRVAVDGVELATPGDFTFDDATGEIVFAPGAVPDAARR